MDNFSMTIVFSTRKINQEYLEHIKKTCALDNLEILYYENNGERSLANVYNEAIKTAKNDYIVFCHDDLIFNTPYWGKKLIKHFKRNPDYGIIGIAGTNHMVDGCWWTKKENMHGIVGHTDGNKVWLSRYSQPQGNKLKQMVALDGLFFAVDRNNLKWSEFDELFNGFHFYEIPFMINNHLNGTKIGLITDINVIHLSVGNLNNSWYENKKMFDTKYKYNLPIKI